MNLGKEVRNAFFTVSAVVASVAACGGGTTGPPPPPSNKAPTANLTVTPTNGNAPLDVIVQVGGSDSDGSVVLYEADLNGDGDYNDTGESQATPIDTQITLEEGTHTIRGRVKDNDGAFSSQRSQQVTATQPPGLNVTVMGHSGAPDASLEPIADAYVEVNQVGSTDITRVQTDANGVANIPNVSGSLEVRVKDELGDGLGQWYNLKSQELNVNGNMSVTYGLVPVVPLPTGTTAYSDGADFNRKVVDNLSVVLRDIDGYPVKIYIDETSAPSQAYVNSARDGFNAWNNNDYEMVEIVSTSEEADYTAEFSSQIPFVDISSKTINLDTRVASSSTKGQASHEFSHIAGHLLEANGPFCSDPPNCSSGVTLFEQGNYTALEAIRPFYVVNFDMDNFESN